MSEADSPGSALRAARQAMGASVPEVANSLRVSWAIIENLEANRFDALPVRVFTRAYIRGYADLAGLDPDEMLSAYDEKTASAETTGIKTRALSTVPRTLATFARDLQVPRWQSRVFGGTVILIMAVSGIFLWLIWPSEAPIVSAPLEQPNPAPIGDPARPVPVADEAPFDSAVFADSSTPVSNDPVEPAPDGPAVQGATPVSSGASGSISNSSPEVSTHDPADDLPLVSVLDDSPNDEVESVPLSNPLTYVPGDDHVLAFRFTHDCWVQVFDAAGALLYEDLERAQGELKVRGDAPFTITLGYSPGVLLEYNGDPVMLAQHTNENVAKLVLGL